MQMINRWVPGAHQQRAHSVCLVPLWSVFRFIGLVVLFHEVG